MNNEIYKNTPIIEAIFEIRFPAELSVKCHIDEFYHKITKKFPFIKPFPYGATHLYDFNSKDNNEIIKVGFDRVSYHTRKYDGGFSKFQEDALKNLQLFINCYKIVHLRRTGLRYINHIPIVRIDGVIPIEKYLNFGYKIPVESIPDKLELLNTILGIKVNDGKLKILIQSKEVDNIVKAEVLVLDFDFLYLGDLKAQDIIEYISKSHKHTKEIFESLITEGYRKVMRGEQENGS